MIELALATGTAPGDWTDGRTFVTALELLRDRNG